MQGEWMAEAQILELGEQDSQQRMIARTRSHALGRWLPTAPCICIVVLLLGIMLDRIPVAAAHSAPLPVFVHANFSDRGHVPTVNVAIRSAGEATCQLTVDVDKHAARFPAMIADARGILMVSWQVPAGAPGGLWAFDVSCARGSQVGRDAEHAAVRLRGRTTTARLVANSSSQLVRGDLVAAGIRIRADSYASSCNRELCFAHDSLWQATGESTWYAMGTRPDLTGIVNASAGDWLREAHGRVPEGTIPVTGAIAVWLPNAGGASSAGHVAYVAGVFGDGVLVDDSNWGEPVMQVHRHLVPATQISGYIYGGPAGGGPSAAVGTAAPPAMSASSSTSSDSQILSPVSVFPSPIAPPGESVPGTPGGSAPPPEEGLSGGPGPTKPTEETGGSGAGSPVDATLPPAPTAPEPVSLESILPQARQIMAQPGTVWSKAAAVRNLVRASLSGQDCGVMATAFWSVGSIVGLPLRLVNSSANGQNAYDTHSTVEVWLAGLGHWAISDPTFNGFWTAGPEGPPVSAEFMQNAVRTGTNDTLYWHGADTPNSILPSQYYVDPTYLYAYTEYMVSAPDVGVAFIVDSEADAFSVPYALIPAKGTDFASLLPEASTPVTVDRRTEAPSAAGVSGFALPLSYADELVYQGQATVGSDGRVALPFANPGPAAVVSVDANVGKWQLEVGEVGALYNLNAYPEARVSPMTFLAPPVYLVASGAEPGPVTVRIWNTKDFPASREVTSQWEGA
jgi:surface antigen